ncbi:uncharacterized protein F54H12.2-like [Dendronephthya gigantea]|uniref:uncharacterized protein F54H12.2-like n=1 Tax=Dendronephthya gigantea TaxID=151771 RepID=UPI00106940F3|nr:uncharacterized protein F54H12.2-like [Dendronephthya gigantea]
MSNAYVRYYLDQQQGRGMAVFRGRPWQMGHGQVGFGLGGLFKSVARAVMPIVKSGAKALDEKVGVVNNFLNSLFKQVDVFLKEKQVTQATGTYAYRLYLGTLLNFELTAALFYKDTAGKFDVSDPTVAVAANTNYGLKKRYKFSSASKTIEMAGPIFSDVLFSERPLLSFVDLKVILNRNINEFCLMASEDGVDYRVKLMDVYLKIRKVKISPTVSMAHEIALKKGPASYPIHRVECKSFIIPAGNPSLRKDNIFNGLVLKSFVCGLVESAAFNGAYKQNPFNFQHFNMSFIGASVNGEEVPLKGMQLSFARANPRYIEAFYTMFPGTGKMNYNTGNDISHD